MRRAIDSNPISVGELARGRFGEMVKGVVDLRRGVPLLDADMHADQEAELLAEGSVFGNRSRGVDDPGIRGAIVALVQRLVWR